MTEATERRAGLDGPVLTVQMPDGTALEVAVVAANAWRRLAEERNALVALVAIADRMYAENAEVVQKASDAKYQAEFGHDGPRVASPLDSAGREYVFERHHMMRTFEGLLPDAMTALGQR